MKYITITLYILLSATVCFAQFAGGSGTVNDPYLIETAQHLDNVRNYLDSYFFQISDIDLSAYADGDGWQPINGFTGTYSSSGYTISNLTINRPTTDNIGLFGYINNATLSGIRLIDVSITGRNNVGSITGHSDDSNVFASYATGTVNGESNIGGLIGLLEVGMIKESFALTSVNGYENVGCLVGKQEAGTIEDCYAWGEVQGTTKLGGLLGTYDGSSSVINSYSIGTVSGNTNLGGLIGYGNGSTTNSYWDIENSGRQTSAGGEGRTTDDMTYPYAANTYVDWDIIFKWVEDENDYHDGYPYLISNTRHDMRPPFPGGSGTFEDPYHVANASDLNNVRGYLNSHFIQIADIDLSQFPTGPAGWLPIGSSNQYFSGTYNGDEYIIENLFIDRPSENEIALFKSTHQNAELLNMNLHDVNISANSIIGSIVGYLWYGSITNSNVTGIINGADECIGGIVGKSYGSSIIKCNSSISIDGDILLGGIVGFNWNSTIDNSSVEGMITGNTNVGGIAGANTRTLIGLGSHIKYSNSDAIISGNTRIGGITGINQNSLIKDCYSISNVDGRIEIGGITGRSEDGNNSELESYIKSSFAAGSVQGESEVGGLVGYNIGQYSYISDSYSSAEVNGEIRVGGLIGLHGFSTIYNSYSTSNTSGIDYVGGLVGYSHGSIENSYSIGFIEGNTNVGGLIGFQTAGYTISNSYWDIESSGQSTSAGGEGKLTVEMVQHDTFDNWDFQDTWEIQKHNPYILKTYPHLQWQSRAGLHNRLDNGLVKLFEDRNWHWDSFPRLERDQYGNQPAPDVLEPLEGIIDSVFAKPYENLELMYWHQGAWQGANIEFNSPDGYKLRTIDEEPYYLHVTGDRIDLNTQITLQPNTVNWVGYFIPSSQCPFDAFSEDILERLEAIRAQNWSMRKDSQGNWVYAADPRPSMEYGKMYEIETSINDPLTFTWNIPHGYPDYLEPSDFTLADNPEYFEYTDSYDYESYFVEDIEEDEGLLEVAVLVDDQCVGASVFNENYPFELQAYTHEGHLGGNISFELYYGRNRGTQRYRVVEVKDPQTGAYTAQTLSPRRQKFALVRIGSQQGMQTPQEPVAMQISNHPNPFNPDTTINFTVSSEQNVELIVYNIKGQKVTTLYEGSAAEGKHSLVWNGTDDRGNAVSSGMYFYRLKAENTELSGKMLLLK